MKIEKLSCYRNIYEKEYLAGTPMSIIRQEYFPDDYAGWLKFQSYVNMREADRKFIKISVFMMTINSIVNLNNTIQNTVDKFRRDLALQKLSATDEEKKQIKEFEDELNEIDRRRIAKLKELESVLKKEAIKRGLINEQNEEI